MQLTAGMCAALLSESPGRQKLLCSPQRIRLSADSSFVSGLMTRISCTFSFLSLRYHTAVNSAFKRFCRPGDSLRRDAFFFNDTASTEIYTLSLHDALPISSASDDCSSCRSSRTRITGSSSEPSSETRSEEHTSELQSRLHLVCRLLLE